MGYPNSQNGRGGLFEFMQMSDSAGAQRTIRNKNLVEEMAGCTLMRLEVSIESLGLMKAGKRAADGVEWGCVTSPVGILLSGLRWESRRCSVVMDSSSAANNRSATSANQTRSSNVIVTCNTRDSRVTRGARLICIQPEPIPTAHLHTIPARLLFLDLYANSFRSSGTISWEEAEEAAAGAAVGAVGAISRNLWGIYAKYRRHVCRASEIHILIFNCYYFLICR